MARKKKMGHYCKVCGRYKANEQFSGKGHKQHICKKCMQLPVEERKKRMQSQNDDYASKPQIDNEPDFEDMMDRILGDYNNEDLELMGLTMHAVDDLGFDALLNAGFYSYRQPDYSAMCSPIELHLHQFFHAENADDLLLASEKVAEVTGRLEQERQEKTIRNLLLNVLADYQRDKAVHGQAILGALWMAEKFNAVGIADTLLELLRQDAGFYSAYISHSEPLFSLAVSILCRDQLDKLSDFMSEEGLIPNSQYIVCDGVIQMAIAHPKRRKEVIEWVSDALELLLDPDADPTPAVIDHIAYSLLQIHAVELLPQLKDLYQVYDVPRIECRKGYRGVKRAMQKGNVSQRIPFSTIDLFLKMQIILADEEEWEDDDDWEDDDFWRDDVSTDSVAPYQPVPFNSFYINTDKPLKLMTIEVILRSRVNGQSQPQETAGGVVRTLNVPSNLRLSHFAKVLLLAMGWQKGYDHYFRKGLDHYSDADYASHFASFGHDWNDYAVIDVLIRKGSEMSWIYELADIKFHDIRVTATKPLSRFSPENEVALVSGLNSTVTGQCFDISQARKEIDHYLGQELPF